MRKLQMYELASAMFAASIFFTLMIAPELFADQITQNPESLYAGYVNMVGSQQNLAFISLGVTMLIFGSFFIRNYNTRIIVNVVAIVYSSFITASYVFNYPNLGLGLLMIMLIWQIYETNKLIDESEDEKSKKILQKSLGKEEIEDDSKKRTNNSR